MQRKYVTEKEFAAATGDGKWWLVVLADTVTAVWGMAAPRAATSYNRLDLTDWTPNKEDLNDIIDGYADGEERRMAEPEKTINEHIREFRAEAKQLRQEYGHMPDIMKMVDRINSKINEFDIES